MSDDRKTLLRRLANGIPGAAAATVEAVETPVKKLLGLPTPRASLDDPCETCKAPPGLDCGRMQCACRWLDELPPNTVLARYVDPDTKPRRRRRREGVVSKLPSRPRGRFSTGPRKLVNLPRRQVGVDSIQEIADEVGVDVYDSRRGAL